MAGRRSRSAADRGDQVIIVTVARDLRPLGLKTFDHPVGGIAARIIDILRLDDAAEAIVSYEQRRVGQEGGSTCRARWLTYTQINDLNSTVKSANMYSIIIRYTQANTHV